MTTVYLALGANLGNRAANLARALLILEAFVRIEAVSPLYESAPQPPSDDPLYLNTACSGSTDLTPEALLRSAKGIEKVMGREPGPRWSPRPIDIDIALYDDLVMQSESLTIPHPRLHERAFVLRPLLDLNPTLVHPKTAERLADLLSAIGESGLSRVGELGWEKRESAYAADITQQLNT